ncbi:hypothetical protein DU506_15770 [Vreelandella rituensis]|uniref:Uncharacterized protein n=1 Tax=Vreelandella rituensis TaxID=2282306 RepID=A0A368TTC5_9GAMM|nr:hypothetical protein DU506_15770 [Halomonas rituensis]
MTFNHRQFLATDIYRQHEIFHFRAHLIDAVLLFLAQRLEFFNFRLQFIALIGQGRLLAGQHFHL